MEFVKKHIITISLFLLATLGNYVWALIQEGGKAEFKTEVKAVMLEAINSHDFMDGVMNTNYMKEYKTINEIRMTKVILNGTDSNRVKMSAALSAKTGLTTEAIVDSLAVIILERNFQKDCVDKYEVKELIRQGNRRIATF
jgi:hypothetical protein